MTFLVKKNYPQKYIPNIAVYLSTFKPIQVMKKDYQGVVHMSQEEKNTHRNIESHEKLRLDNQVTAKELDDRND